MAILTAPTDEELRALAEAYALGGLREARGLEAGTVNTSYLLELDAGRHFLRIYEEQGPEGAAREARVLGHLAAEGVPTPAPVVGRDGAAMRLVCGKPAALFPWVEGEILCQRRVTPEAAAVVGGALARVHLAGHAPGAALDGGRFGPVELAARCARIAGSRDPEARALEGELRDAVLAFDARRRRDLPAGLVHGDLFRDNVLWHRDRCSIAALLDFESAHDGPFTYDLAVTLLSWSYGDALDTAIARAMVEGYRAVRPLTEPEAAALHDEAIFATLRFTITRITDDAIRVGKRWQRFVERRRALEALGPTGFREALGL